MKKDGKTQAERIDKNIAKPFDTSDNLYRRISNHCILFAMKCNCMLLSKKN
jgi:hypothetical protein